MQRMVIRRRGARCSGSGAVALNLLRASLTAVPFSPHSRRAAPNQRLPFTTRRRKTLNTSTWH